MTRLVISCSVILLIAIFTPTHAKAGLFGSSNYSECIIDMMPGTKNDTVAREIRRQCKNDHPSDKVTEKKSSLFGPNTAGECLIKYAEDVSSKRAAKAIRRACNNLYPR